MAERPMHRTTIRELQARVNERQKRIADLEARLREYEELLDAAHVYIGHCVPVEEALTDGFDAVAWCDTAEPLLARAALSGKTRTRGGRNE